MLPYQIIAGGYFTSDSTLMKEIQLSDRPDFFWLRNRTAWGDDAAETSVESWWRRGMAQGSAQTTDQAVTSGILSSEAVTSGGFTFIDTANPPTFAAITNGTTIDATTFVALTATTTGINVGDYVRIINPVGMLQVGGMIFQVTAVSAGVSLTLGYMATAVSAGLSIAANASSFSYRKVYLPRFYPRELSVAYITQAVQAKVYFTQKNDFTVGEMVDFNVPTSYGMFQISNLTAQSRGPARVLVVTNSATESSITLDLDTSGYSAFVYPASATFQAVNSPAVCMPAGAGVIPFNGSATIPQQPPGTNLQAAFDNRNRYIMQLGSNVITSAEAVYDWQAMRYDVFVAE